MFWKNAEVINALAALAILRCRINSGLIIAKIYQRWRWIVGAKLIAVEHAVLIPEAAGSAWNRETAETLLQRQYYAFTLILEAFTRTTIPHTKLQSGQLHRDAIQQKGSQNLREHLGDTQFLKHRNRTSVDGNWWNYCGGTRLPHAVRHRKEDNYLNYLATRHVGDSKYSKIVIKRDA